MTRSTKSRPTTGRSAARREELRRKLLVPPGLGLRETVARPGVLGAGLLVLVFALVAGSLVAWAREQPRADVDQIMVETRIGRIDHVVVDEGATENLRREAQRSAARVYRPNGSFLERLAADLVALPVAIEGRESLEGVLEEMRTSYRLTPEALPALRLYAKDGVAVPQWQRWVENLVGEQLTATPLLGGTEYQEYMRTLRRELIRGDGIAVTLGERAIEIDLGAAGQVPPRLREIVRDAGFPTDVAPYIQARLLATPRDTILFDADATSRAADAAAAAVEPVVVEHRRGEIIYRRGDRLTAQQYGVLRHEIEAFAADAPALDRWLPRVGAVGLAVVLAGFVAGLVAIAYPRVRRNPIRAFAIGSLMTAMLAVSVVATVHLPKLLYPASIAPTLFATIVLLLAYDRRLATILGIVQCALVALALERGGAWGVGWFVVLMAGCGTTIAQLPTVRHRNSLIRSGMVTAIVLGGSAIVLGLFALPNVPGLASVVVAHATWAVASSIAVAFFVLGILPSIERAFDITTGMTLAELRDPSQPLLRQLQQLAPGTYNHSLQVANIAESAADAVGADSLLCYVGAMYHDIGKMNKPEYFVENQADGYNRHVKLRPAMSLLVIVGHVKDGVELAREYGLPRAIQHFIESHHGTTLVEYFFHAAKEQAAGKGEGPVDEFEFRYPGPKPQSREAAIVMLADTVESASRAMAEPNPKRIESLVRELSRKKLLDGQFDECDLTFRDLGIVQDAMVARLRAIHHGRIAYPKAKDERAPRERDEPAAATRERA